jgi:hypothetical protein
MRQRRRRIKNFATLLAAAIPDHARGQPVELGWQDQAGVGQPGSLTDIWADQGSRPRAPRDQQYNSTSIFGAVWPARGVGAALLLPHVSTYAMNLHLAEISTQVAPAAHAAVTLDGAGWHQQGGRLKLPDNSSLLPLPRYSPKLNPQHNIWQCLRQNCLANRVYNTSRALVDACCNAWNDLIAAPNRITSIASRPWTKAVSA